METILKENNFSMNNQDAILINQAAIALRKAALNEDAKKYILSNEPVFKLLLKAAKRYIGGEYLSDCINTVKVINNKPHKATVDFMGESIRNANEANDVTEEFLKLKQEILSNKLDCTISLDLSHIGLMVSKNLAVENLKQILMPVNSEKIEVVISAEGTDRTDHIISVYKLLGNEFENIGITLQAYLYRTAGDLKELINYQGKIRIVKGAFETPAELSMPRGEELDAAYLSYVETLLQSNHLCSIATHDNTIQNTCKSFIEKYKPTNYEFESLLGICEDNLLKLSEQDYNTRQYVVYGKEWYLYLCNRLAEHPPGIYQAINDIVF